MECALVVVVYSLGLWFWNSRVPLDTPTWYALPGGRWHLTAAGYWYVFVSIPIGQFILLRWYVRLFVWYRFLWQVFQNRPESRGDSPGSRRRSRLPRQERVRVRPDPVRSGRDARRHGGQPRPVPGRKPDVVPAAGRCVHRLLRLRHPRAPVDVHAGIGPRKRKGVADYGLLAQRYVEGFEQKWVRDPTPADELLGAADIQSLADLGNSYGLVRDMRPVAFGLDDVTRLAVATAVPLLPSR